MPFSGSASYRPINNLVRDGARELDLAELQRRTFAASTLEECRDLLPEIEFAAESVTDPVDRARLLLCRARVRSLHSLYHQACEDAAAAVPVFERAGEVELAVDAASLAAAHAARLGDVPLACELATKSILGLDSITDDRLRMEVTNRLGVFCYYYLDYEGAVEQFEYSLAAAERLGDRERVCRELYNVVDALLLRSHELRLAEVEVDTDLLRHAEATARKLVVEEKAVTEPRLGTSRLLAEVLCELGRTEDALKVLDDFRRSYPRSCLVPCAELAWVESRCLRLAGRIEEALAAARRDVDSVEKSEDEHDLMLTLEELAACEEATGDLHGALRHTREVRRHMWAIHKRQTRQLVQQVWSHVDLAREHRKLQNEAAEATRSAEEDDLTGIGNRRLLTRFLREAASRRSDIACIIADVDSFKEINDAFGHDVGDAVLTEIGKLFSRNIRAGQVAIRYGGDEFVIALSGVDMTGAYGAAERIRLAVSSFDWTRITPGLQLTMSMGVACGPAAEWQVALSAADERLLAAKRRGRNTVVTGSIEAVTA